MKARFVIAALLLMAFGSVKAQETITVPVKGDTIQVVVPDMSQLPELLRELGEHLQVLTDSVDWKSVKKDVEEWTKDMEEWGRKMEKWSEGGTSSNETPKKGEPKVSTVRIAGPGNVHITQCPDMFALICEDQNVEDYRVEDNVLFLAGTNNYDVLIQELKGIQMVSSGDVFSKGTLTGQSLNIEMNGSGDMLLHLEYDTVFINHKGSGNIYLTGQCKVLYADVSGSGGMDAEQFRVKESYVKATGSGKVKTSSVADGSEQNSRNKFKVHKNLLYDAHWNGFEAGLNMLVNTNVDHSPQNLSIRPMRSWYFGFNIADVGIAFNKKHQAGLFTGVGFGWNNFSWSNNIHIGYDEEGQVYTVEPNDDERIVRNTKYGALFLQVPLMLEVRPTPYMYIDLGVTGGVRIAQWNRIKYAVKPHEKYYYNGATGTKLLKLDASLRVGVKNVGFFANYALLPLLEIKDTETSNIMVHPLSFGFSINF